MLARRVTESCGGRGVFADLAAVVPDYKAKLFPSNAGIL